MQIVTMPVSAGHRYQANACLYRGPNDTKCAIGVLIPDERMRIEFELKQADYVMEQMPDIFGHKSNLDSVYPLAGSLQSVHDYFEPNKWAAELRRVAKTYGLDAHVVNEMEATQ